MNTSPMHLTTPPALRPFHTPVRGSVFADRPATERALRVGTITLRREPDNPADRWAVAVWLEHGGTPWRVGYLDRGVAARLARLDAASLRAVPVRFAGWWEDPSGRWRRPVVQVGGTGAVAPRATGLRALPPFSHRSARAG